MFHIEIWSNNTSYYSELIAKASDCWVFKSNWDP